MCRLLDLNIVQLDFAVVACTVLVLVVSGLVVDANVLQWCCCLPLLHHLDEFVVVV